MLKSVVTTHKSGQNTSTRLGAKLSHKSRVSVTSLCYWYRYCQEHMSVGLAVPPYPYSTVSCPAPVQYPVPYRCLQCLYRTASTVHAMAWLSSCVGSSVLHWRSIFLKNQRANVSSLVHWLKTCRGSGPCQRQFKANVLLHTLRSVPVYRYRPPKWTPLCLCLENTHDRCMDGK